MQKQINKSFTEKEINILKSLIGQKIDKRKNNQYPEYAEKAEDFVRELTITKNKITTNFSFALIMVVLGLVIVLLAVLL